MTDEEILNAKIVFNNMKNHDFSVSDYRMSKTESEIVKDCIITAVATQKVIDYGGIINPK